MDISGKTQFFKWLILLAHLGGAAALIGASYSGCNTTLTVLLLTIAGGLNGAAFAGFGVSWDLLQTTYDNTMYEKMN